LSLSFEYVKEEHSKWMDPKCISIYF